MKRTWDTAELEEHWTLSTDERQAARDNKTYAGRLGFALLLKWFEYEGRFPQSRSDAPPDVLGYLARQLDLSPSVFGDYEWGSRTMERHRSQIRERLGFHEATTADAQMLSRVIADAFTNLYPLRHCVGRSMRGSTSSRTGTAPTASSSMVAAGRLPPTGRRIGLSPLLWRLD